MENFDEFQNFVLFLQKLLGKKKVCTQKLKIL